MDRVLIRAQTCAAVSPFIPGPWDLLTTDQEIDSFDAAACPPSDGMVRAVRFRPLPFLPGYTLLESLDRAEDNSVRMKHWLLCEDAMVPLDGSTSPIHAANKKAFRCDGDPAAVIDYLSFFTSFCRTDSGRFHLGCSTADLSDSEIVALDRADDSTERFAQQLIAEPAVEKTDRGWRVTASLLYDRSLFHATFHIQRTGYVEMIDDALKLENVLKKPEAWCDDGLTVTLRGEWTP